MLLTPKQIKNLFPLKEKEVLFIERSRQQIQQIFLREEKKKLVIVGPCSVHEEGAILEYAEKIKALSKEVKNFTFVLRFFIEKSRSSLGWAGFLTDPFLDGSCQIQQGMMLSRKILTTMAQNEIPCAMEFLQPFFAPYFEDIISLGFIGSRTSSSPVHRYLASSLPFAVGFKNSHTDAIDVTLQSILTARSGHAFPSLNEEGHLFCHQSKGNLFAHLVLRGSLHGPNADSITIAQILQKCAKLKIQIPLVVDCSHENSKKDLEKQKECFRQTVLQGNADVAGLMLESYLFSGNQSISSRPLKAGISITDPCLGWEETKALLLEADALIG
jgi:3-deoxy-7-phosphoheptulonate synthase